MSDSAPIKVTRLSELPRDIPPPRDGWPALEARLRWSGARRSTARRSAVWFAGIAAAVAAVVAGILVDRLFLQTGHPDVQRQLAARHSSGGTIPLAPEAAPPRVARAELPATFITDPRYVAERAALLASLDERLKSLPPQTRQQVLASLATIHRSMQQIQQALGREPANALLQGLLIDTYQDEMRVLTAVQEAGSAGGES
ncbi:MAG: hypothetical protein ACREUT_00055 [Steroidobacteraceae bacterium]